MTQTRIKQRFDVLSNWLSNDIVLLNGELAVVDCGEQIRFKVGDGTSKFSELLFTDQNQLCTKYIEAEAVSQGIHAGSKPYGMAAGAYLCADASFSQAFGFNSQTVSTDNYSFTWNGDDTRAIGNYYQSHGKGTFNLNALSGIDGIYIGEQTLGDLLSDATGSKITINDRISSIIEEHADLSIVKLNALEYAQLVSTSAIISNCLYVVEDSYRDAFGEQIKNVAAGTDLSDAVTLEQLQATSSSLSNVLSNYYLKSDTSSASEISNALSAKADLSSVEHVVQYEQDYNGNYTAVTIGSRRSSLSTDIGPNSFVNGYNCQADGVRSHAEGIETYAGDSDAHAEGSFTSAFSDSSHAEGYGTITNNVGAHAEGGYTSAFGYYSHAEGGYTSAFGYYSHVEGGWTSTGTNAIGAHAEGGFTRADGPISHVEGIKATSELSDFQSFVWQGTDYMPSSIGDIDLTRWDEYKAHGPGTFNINPVGGLSGMYIGEQSLANAFELSSGNKVFIDNHILSSAGYSDLSIVKLSADEYTTLLTSNQLLSNALYVVEDGHVDAYGEQIKNVAYPIDLSDAATKEYVDNAVSDVQIPEDLSSFTNSPGYLVSNDISDYYKKSETSSASEINDAIALSAGNKIYIDDRISSMSGYSDLSIIRLSASEYENLPQEQRQLSNALYVVEDDTGDNHGKQIKNLAPGTDLSDAVNLEQLSNAISSIQIPTDLSAFTNSPGYLVSNDISALSNELSSKQDKLADAQLSDINYIPHLNQENTVVVFTDGTVSSFNVGYINSDIIQSWGKEPKSIKIGTNCTQIAGGFKDKTSLTSITFAEERTTELTVRYQAFQNTGITSIVIPEFVKFQDYGNLHHQFSYCQNLKEAIYKCSSINNTFSYSPNLTSIAFTDNLKYIGSTVFYENQNLKYISIPNSVTAIEEHAFSSNTGLTSIVLPEKIHDIKDSTFFRCSSLASIDIPSEVSSIYAQAFWGCSSLTSIDIPDSVKRIGIDTVMPTNYGWPFGNCVNLSNVTVGTGVTDIISNAFDNCANLTSIVFRNRLSSEIPSGAPWGATNATVSTWNDASQEWVDERIPYVFNDISATSYTLKDHAVNFYGFNGGISSVTMTMPELNQPYAQDFLLDITNDNDTDAVIEFNGLGISFNFAVKDGDDLVDMTTIIPGAFIRFYVTQTGFRMNSLPTFEISRKIVAEAITG